MAAGAVGGCSAFDALVRPPVSARGAAAYTHALNLSRRTAIRRRVYSCVLFGFELEVLGALASEHRHARMFVKRLSGPTAKTRDSAVRIYSIFSDRSSLVAKTGNVTRMGHMWVADGMMRKVLRLGTIQPLHTTAIRCPYNQSSMY